MEKMLFSILIFLLFLTLFTSALVSSTVSNLYNNQIGNYTSNENITVLQTASGSAIPTPPICKGNSNILVQIYEMGVCAGNYVIWIYSLATISSDIQWLGYLLLGCIAVMVLIGIKILSGVIPTIGGVH